MLVVRTSTRWGDPTDQVPCGGDTWTGAEKDAVCACPVVDRSNPISDRNILFIVSSLLGHTTTGSLTGCRTKIDS